jgi:serine/threonine-protein phosphatase CPPED1
MIACLVLFVSCASCCGPSLGAGPLSESFRFIQMCDTQLGFGGYEEDCERFRQAVRQINAMDDIDFVVICGDLVNTADEQSYRDFLSIRGGFRVPCHCASGNHDVGNVPTAESLALYRQRIGDDYYSFEHKGAVFVIVNTQLWKSPVAGETERQDAWLRGTLAAARDRRRPVFIVGHYPLFTDDPQEPENYFSLPLETRRELLDLFEHSGVVAVLAGHTHRTIIRNHRGIEMVSSTTTSRNFDDGPFGFRIWDVADGIVSHRMVPLEGPAAGGPSDSRCLRLSDPSQHPVADVPAVEGPVEADELGGGVGVLSGHTHQTIIHNHRGIE